MGKEATAPESTGEAIANDDQASEDETAQEPLFPFAEKVELEAATVAEPTGPTSDAL